MQIFKKLLFLLTPRERKRAIVLLIMITIMALLDVIGIASIMPFMAVLTNPGLIESNYILNTMFRNSAIFGVENNQDFIFALGILVFILLIVSMTFKLLTSYLQIQFVQMREYSIGKRLVEGYLKQPYSWFASRNSTDFGKTILSEVAVIIGNGIGPLIELIAKSIVAIAIISLLFIADPKLAFIVGLTLGTVYLIIFYIVRKILNQLGQKRLKNNELRFLEVNEAFSATKEIKVRGLEETYIKNFSKSAQSYAKAQGSFLIISQLPRFILEAIAFGGILIVILNLISQTGSLNNAIPVISLYVFAGYRLMPTIQQIYINFTQLTFVGPSVDKLYQDLISLKVVSKNHKTTDFPFYKSIILNNIHYSYPQSNRTALKDISLTIKAKTTVGFVGTTGSGKTTIVDIILALLEAQKGTLEVDGKVITKQNSRAWQLSIGYVPQHIYLADDTVAANIAFGVDDEKINQKMVEKSAKVANLHNFVIDELPKQYNTSIGDRGIKLSGGQRQRIGIARALYHNPKILILDEATSALDNQTEEAVMDAINNLGKNMTIILIAHRLNTIKNCDIIFKLDKGQIVSQGNYDEIFKDIVLIKN